jgi:hypothetical protein
MAYQKTNLGQPGEFDFVEDVYGKPDQWAELNATKSKLGFLWDGFKKYSKKYVLDPLVDIFGDRVPEVVNTAADILQERGEAAIVKAIQDGPGTQEEKNRLIVAAASQEVNKMEQQTSGGGALIPIVIAALSIGVLFGGRK